MMDSMEWGEWSEKRLSSGILRKYFKRHIKIILNLSLKPRNNTQIYAGDKLKRRRH